MTLTMCLDFDGVIHSYTSPWTHAARIDDPPVDGAFDFIIRALSRDWQVVVHSSRLGQSPNAPEAMIRWFLVHGFPEDKLANDAGDEEAISQLWDEFPRLGIREPCLRLSALKPAAFITLDDRALTFMGQWPDLDMLLLFKVWNKP